MQWVGFYFVPCLSLPVVPSSLAKLSVRVPSTPELCKLGAGAAGVSPVGDKYHIR